MLGKSHAQCAALSWVALVALGHRAGVRLDGELVAISTAAATAGGLSPDLDHPGSGATRNLGPVGKVTSWAIRKAAGGHRGRTHTLGAVLMAAGAMLVAQSHPVVLAVVLGLLVATAVDVMPKVPEGVEWLAAAAVGYSSMSAAYPVWLLPLAVGWGWHVHLICDRCTIERIPYAWPFRPESERVAWGLFKTGSPAERWTVRGVWVATLAVVATPVLPLR